ncbi:MAG: hypothetical protein ACRC18_06765 [Cetobacterium sp.]
MRLNNLRECFNGAIENGAKFIGVKVWMFGFEECEVIINPVKNFEKKLEYYQSAYNEDLTLKNAPSKIKIIGFTYGGTFDAVEKDLI